jgi:hypothetical protein
LMPTAERRNYRTRAEVFTRVVAWLRSLRSPAVGVPDELAERSVGTRILKHLMRRCLVKKLPEGWLPTRVLINDVYLPTLRERETF